MPDSLPAKKKMGKQISESVRLYRRYRKMRVVRFGLWASVLACAFGVSLLMLRWCIGLQGWHEAGAAKESWEEARRQLGAGGTGAIGMGYLLMLYIHLGIFNGWRILTKPSLTWHRIRRALKKQQTKNEKEDKDRAKAKAKRRAKREKQEERLRASR
jgi:hypothetical protein